MNRSALASVAFSSLLVALGCSGSSSNDLDDPSSSADELRAAAACSGKACGASCTLCQGEKDCVETAVLKQCSASGHCSSSAAACGPVVPPPPYDPCAGKACGATCSICPPGDAGCVETAVVKQCNAAGQCSASSAACVPPPPPPAYEPCAGKACGASCTICPPGDPNCFETAVVKQCSAAGACTPGTVSCTPPYNPCAGKACGASCTLCAPGDTGCVETAVLKQCNAAGTCNAGSAGCGK